jgi:hypothetical protein
MPFYPVSVTALPKSRSPKLLIRLIPFKSTIKDVTWFPGFHLVIPYSFGYM